MTYPHTYQTRDEVPMETTAWHYTVEGGRRASGTLSGEGLQEEADAVAELARQHGVPVESVRVRRVGEHHGG